MGDAPAGEQPDIGRDLDRVFLCHGETIVHLADVAGSDRSVWARHRFFDQRRAAPERARGRRFLCTSEGGRRERNGTAAHGKGGACYGNGAQKLSSCCHGALPQFLRQI